MSLPTAPLTGQSAIDAAVARLGGSMPDSGLCLQFTRQCYEVPSYYYSAIDAWNGAVEQHPDDRNPPPSASVWFWSDSVYRHIAFHIGDNQYATTYNAEIRQYPLSSMESIFGPLIGWAPDLNGYSLRPESGPVPPEPTPSWEDDEMIRISAPGRGIAVVGPGYYKSLTEEEFQNSEPLVSKTVEGSDRQFDLWVAIATQGRSAPQG